MASNFALPDNFPSAPYQPMDYVFFQNGSIQGNLGNAIFLGLNREVGCTMTRQRKQCIVIPALLVYCKRR